MVTTNQGQFIGHILYRDVDMHKYLKILSFHPNARIHLLHTIFLSPFTIHLNKNDL